MALVDFVLSDPLMAGWVGELTRFGRFAVNGLVVGSILALAGVGLTLVYGILRLANFARGDFLTLGTYLTMYFVALIAFPATQTMGLLYRLGCRFSGLCSLGRPWRYSRSLNAEFTVWL